MPRKKILITLAILLSFLFVHFGVRAFESTSTSFEIHGSAITSISGRTIASSTILTKTLDPLYHPSPANFDYCGDSAAIGVGDVNNDGKGDVVMGCYGDNDAASDQGSAVVFTRNAGNDGFDTGVVLYHPTASTTDYCGNSVAIGDVNNDGKGDVVMGCPGDDNATNSQGSVVVFTRNAGNDGFDTGVVLYHPSPVNADDCGYSTAIGDVNNDTKGDVVMGCYQDDNTVSGQGSVVVFTRNAGNDGFDTGVVLYHPSPGTSDICGWSAASGDVNNDGKGDVVMGCYQDNDAASDQGSAVVFTRNAGNDGFDTGVVLYHPTASTTDNCGWSAAIGDVNNDTKGDVVMGCRYDDNATNSQGSVVVFTRNAGNDGFDTGVVLYHPSPVEGDCCGTAAAIGDVNNDTKGDVVMGCGSDDDTVSNQGSVVVFTRNTGNDGFDTGLVFYHPSPVNADCCGFSAASGDVNNDGKGDVVMGCYYDDNTASDQGSAVIVESEAGPFQILSAGGQIATGISTSTLKNLYSGILYWLMGFYTPRYEQIHYRWRNDNGGESGEGWSTSSLITTGGDVTSDFDLLEDSLGNLFWTFGSLNNRAYLLKSTNQGSSWSTSSELTLGDDVTRGMDIFEDSSGNLFWTFGSLNNTAYLLKSTNQGSSWSSSSVITTGDDVRSGIDFLEDSLGNLFWTFGSWDYRAYILKSTNQGTSWATSSTIRTGSFVDSGFDVFEDSLDNLFWTFGSYDDKAYLLKSTNQGSSWSTSSEIKTGGDVKSDVDLLEDSSGNLFWAFGSADNKAYLMKSTNQGTSWSTSSLITTGDDVDGGMDIFEDSLGNLFWTFGSWNDKAYLLKSTDHGDSWSTSSEIKTGGDVSSGIDLLEDSSGNLFWTFGSYDNNAYLLKSTDHGTSWSTSSQITTGVDNVDSGMEIFKDSLGNLFWTFGSMDNKAYLYKSSAAASWAANEDTSITDLVKGMIKRLRFEISNEAWSRGGPQSFRIEYAQTNDCPNGSYVAATTSATLHWQIASSTYFNDGSSTTNVGGGLTDENAVFTAGQLKDEGNQTSAITVTSENFTELEFSIRATNNAANGAIYCFRLTNAGVATNYVYTRYATTSVAAANNVPTVSAVNLYPSPIILNENTTTTVYCDASSTDLDGGGDISTGTAKIFRSGASATSTCNNDNYCYQVAKCGLGGVSGNNRDINCTTTVWFHAEATDASSSYSAQTWQCEVKAIDSQSASSTATDSTPPELNTRFAFLITPTIGYGLLYPNTSSSVAQITTATTTGNSGIDLNLYGVDMATTGFSIAVNNQEYASSTFTHSGGIGKDLGYSPGTTTNLDLTKPTTHPSSSTDDIYWKIFIPSGQFPATYTGTTTISATYEM